MNEKLVLLLLLISVILIYLYIKTQHYTNYENFFNSCRRKRLKVKSEGMTNMRLNKYGIPYKNRRKNVAYISVIACDVLDIYLDRGSKININQVDLRGKRIGRATGCDKIHNFVTEFNPYKRDRLMFYNYNHDGPFYWAGHIYLNGKFYPTNSNNFKIVSVFNPLVRRKTSFTTKLNGRGGGFRPGYKRIGCYRDNRNRALPLYSNYRHNGGRGPDYPSCYKAALRANKRYFALQNGNQCFLGNDLNRATRYGRVSDRLCRDRSKTKRHCYQWSTGGNSWVNDIHDTQLPPSIRYYPSNKGNWPSLRNFRNINPKIKNQRFINGTHSIQPNIGGGGTGHRNRHGEHFKKMWVQYQFSIKVSQKIEFCPDRHYQEFNPGGCHYPWHRYKCIETVKKGFKPNMRLCQNTFHRLYRKNNYNNKEFFTLLDEFFKISSNFDDNFNQFNKRRDKNANYARKQYRHVKWFINRTIWHLKRCTRLACLIGQNKEGSKFEEKYQCYQKLVKSKIGRKGSKDITHLVADMLYKAFLPPPGVSVKDDPNKSIQRRLNHELYWFLQVVRVAIYKNNDLFLHCSCLNNSIRCNPC